MATYDVYAKTTACEVTPRTSRRRKEVMADIVDRLRCTALIRAINHPDNDPIKLESLEAANEIERLRAALKNIRELNFTSDGWAHSDLIEQEIVFALAQPAAPGGGA